MKLETSTEIPRASPGMGRARARGFGYFLETEYCAVEIFRRLFGSAGNGCLNVIEFGDFERHRCLASLFQTEIRARERLYQYACFSQKDDSDSTKR